MINLPALWQLAVYGSLVYLLYQDPVLYQATCLSLERRYTELDQVPKPGRTEAHYQEMAAITDALILMRQTYQALLQASSTGLQAGTDTAHS